MKTATTLGAFIADLMEKVSHTEPEWLAKFLEQNSSELLDDLFLYQAALGVVLGAGNELDQSGIEEIGWLGASLSEIGRAVLMPDRFILRQAA